MSRSLQRLIALVLISGLVLHFILVILSGGPEDSKFTAFAEKYTEPLFHQTWKLFVPPPEYNYQIYVRSFRHQAWSQWQNELAGLVQKHQQNRLAGHELELLTLSNALFYLNNELPDTNAVYNTPPETPVFKVFRRAVLHCPANVETAETTEVVIIRKNKAKQNTYYFRNLH